MNPIRLHIFGAPGSGTTTLGRALADTLELLYVDTDDICFVPTDPPYTKMRTPEERTALLRQTLAGREAWVISGSLAGWGDVWIPELTLAVFLSVPAEVRVERLKARERARFGARILPGGDMCEENASFIAWAADYDRHPVTDRSLAMHEAWIPKLACPVLRLDGTLPIATLVRRINEHLPRA